MGDSLPRKSIVISELRQMVRSILREVLQEEDKDTATSKTVPAPASHADSVAKTIPAPLTAKQGSGKQLHVPVSGRGDTRLTNIDQMSSKQTVPAHASNAERAAQQDFQEKGLTRTGQLAPRASLQSQKAQMVSKKLAAKNMNVNAAELKKWIDQMDPADVLIKTDDELANEYISSAEQEPDTLRSA